MSPVLSFVVPCYKLAHFLSECVESILGQSYRDLEVLIMDDCSPDNTPEVVRSFTDRRVRYVRNEQNLGHLQNYNKGIRMARGEYIWLISADDRLRSVQIAETYINIMQQHLRVGYIFCPGIALNECGKETGLLRHYYHGSADKIFQGRVFVRKILTRGGILSPSVVVRRKCYERFGLFPADMPHQGDMYLWCIWALHYDVAYCAQPMVNYRVHEASMMSGFSRNAPQVIVQDELKVLWAIMERAELIGDRRLSKQCQSSIARKYSSLLLNMLGFPRQAICGASVHECAASIAAFTNDPRKRNRISAAMLERVGDEYRWSGDRVQALYWYRQSLRANRLMAAVWLRVVYLRTLGNCDRANRACLMGMRLIRRSPAVSERKT